VRILGIDYGERRVGLALSDPFGSLALPLRVAEVTGDKQAVRAVGEAVEEFDVERIVVGLPLNMNGTEGPMAEKVRAFVSRVGQACGIPVEMWDERLSTGLVERTLLQADVSRKKRRKVRDKLAAQVILQGYLDAQAENLSWEAHPPYGADAC